MTNLTRQQVILQQKIEDIEEQIEWLRGRQRDIGDLKGYIAYFGDPENPKPNGTWVGNGGTHIYNQDIDALREYEEKLLELKSKYNVLSTD